MSKLIRIRVCNLDERNATCDHRVFPYNAINMPLCNHEDDFNCDYCKITEFVKNDVQHVDNSKNVLSPQEINIAESVCNNCKKNITCHITFDNVPDNPEVDLKISECTDIDKITK